MDIRRILDRALDWISVRDRFRPRACSEGLTQPVISTCRYQAARLPLPRSKWARRRPPGTTVV